MHRGAAVGDPEVRAAELVWRADQDVGVDRAHVDRLVSGVVDRIDPRQRAGLVRHPADALGVDHRADRVRRPRERHHPGAIGELGLKVVEVERRVALELDVADHEVAVVSELEPRRDAAVVVQRRDEDLVTGIEAAPRGPRQHEVKRRHVGTEDDLLRLTAEEPRGAGLGGLEDRLDAQAGLVACPEVGARLAQSVARSRRRPRRGPGSLPGRRGRRTRPAATRTGTHLAEVRRAFSTSAIAPSFLSCEHQSLLG